MVIELFICTFSLKMLPCDNIDMLSLGMCHNGKLRIIYLCFTNENTNISKKCFIALRCPQGRLNLLLNYNKLILPQNFVTPCNLEPISRSRPCFRYFKTSWSNLLFSLLRSLKYWSYQQYQRNWHRKMWSLLSLHSNKGSHLRTSRESEFRSFARCHTGIRPIEWIHLIRVTRKIMAALLVKVSFLPSIAAIVVSIDLWSRAFFRVTN